MIPVIRKGLDKSGTDSIVDLCSGGGGGIMKIMEHLKKENVPVKVVLTDKYPNIATFRNAQERSGGGITFVEESIDARDVPSSLKGFRTQFVSFHHFKPEDAKSILENAAASGAVIGIFEATERSVVNFIAMLFTPVVIWLATPFIRPFKWSRLLFTYIIPAIPLFTMWDGLVSVLRTYSEKELKQMTSQIPADYTWEIGRVRKPGAPAIIYLLGYPNKK
jgi:hypothetical protein